MVTSRSRREMILSFVNQATDASDLIKLISFIPLHSLQACAKRYVADASQSAINEMYHTALPMDQIIPHDVIQNISSFNPLSIAQQCVSKSFKALSDKNAAIELKQRNQIIQHPKFNFDIDFRSGTRWIVDPNRQQLTQEEIALGYKGLFDLEETWKQCHNEDVLLLYGEHTIDISSSSSFWGNDKDVSLIGMSDNVIITIEDKDESLHWAFANSKLYLKNVHLRPQCSDDFIEIEIGRHAHLWMEQCRLVQVMFNTRSCPMGSVECGSFHVKNCDFEGNEVCSSYGGRPEPVGAIYIDVDIHNGGCEVMIVGCTFSGWGNVEAETEQPCIVILHPSVPTLRNVKQQKEVNDVTIVWNIFSNNKGRSILFDPYTMNHSDASTPQIESFLELNVTVHSNICQNKNGRWEEQISPFQKPNPNQIEIVWDHGIVH